MLLTMNRVIMISPHRYSKCNLTQTYSSLIFPFRLFLIVTQLRSKILFELTTNLPFTNAETSQARSLSDHEKRLVWITETVNTITEMSYTNTKGYGSKMVQIWCWKYLCKLNLKILSVSHIFNTQWLQCSSLKCKHESTIITARLRKTHVFNS